MTTTTQQPRPVETTRRRIPEPAPPCDFGFLRWALTGKFRCACCRHRTEPEPDWNTAMTTHTNGDHAMTDQPPELFTLDASELDGTHVLDTEETS